MVIFICILLSFLVGGLLPVQGAINTQLSAMLRHPVKAAFVSFFMGTLFLGGINLIPQFFRISAMAITEIPPHLFIGGIIGALFVTSVIYLVPMVGTAVLLGSSVTGQLIVSLVIDHYGLFNVPVHSVSIPRIIGVVMLIGGVYLIQRF